MNSLNSRLSGSPAVTQCPGCVGRALALPGARRCHSRRQRRQLGCAAGTRAAGLQEQPAYSSCEADSIRRARPTAFDSDDYEVEPQQQQQAAQLQQQAADCASGGGGVAESGGGLVGAAVGAWMALIALVARLLSPAVSLVLALAQPLTRMAPARARRHLDKLVRPPQLAGSAATARPAPALTRAPACHRIPRPPQLAELPDGFLARCAFISELPLVRRLRLTLSLANVGVRLPAMLALLLAQGSALASQVSLPMLAVPLLGTGEKGRACQLAGLPVAQPLAMSSASPHQCWAGLVLLSAGMMLNTIRSNAEYIMPRGEHSSQARRCEQRGACLPAGC